jgi:hypothetical protein
MTPVPPTAIRWHRIIGVIILALLFAEGAARLAVYAWSGQPYRSLSPYVWSPYGVVRNNPRLTSPAFVNDKNGFRDVQNFSQRKPANTLRVMLLGASTMYSGLQGHVWDVIPSTGRVDSRSTIAQFLRDALVADPALAGLDIEVINAAVNMNRIVEVSSAYLAEYAHWNPDFVIVGGSANNFGFVLPKGAVRRRDYGFMSTHVWRSEFERIVNRNDLLSAFENGVRALGDHSAATAIGAKMLSKVVDAAFGRSAAMARRLEFAHQSTKAIVPADWDEYDQYVDEYLGYASAMVALARHNHQHIAFFWEHFLAQIGKMKHLTENEKKLFEANLEASSDLDAAFTFHARDRVAAFCMQNGVPFLDPIERLKAHSGSVFIDYVHYTAEGNRFMAGFIYNQLRDAFHLRAKELLADRELR